MKTRRIGILTGGGDAPGLNAVIRAVTKSALLGDGIEVIGIRDGFEGLILPDRIMPLTLDSVRGILPRGGTVLGTTNRGNPFNYPVEKDGRATSEDLSDQVVARISELGIDALLVVGGDGSLRIGRDLARKGVPVVGIPKTIDNDLSSTDATFGYNTALTTATEALDKLHTTAESHHRIMLLEVMGRYAGWIALESGIAGGADAILIPEIPYRLAPLCETVEKRRKLGRMFSIFVVAEGALEEGGNMVFEAGHSPVAGREPKLGGVGMVVARRVSAAVACEARVTVLGHLQRGGSPTVFDRLLGSRFGLEAVHCARRGEFNRMVALHGQAVVSVPLEEAVDQLKRVKPDGSMALAAEVLGISLGR